jgi:hypothetical protein
MMKSVLASCRGLNELMSRMSEKLRHGLPHPLAKALNRFRGKKAGKAHKGQAESKSKG